jgi:hypothetical protein
MGALLLQKPGQHNDSIGIATNEVQEESDGTVTKKSTVTLAAQRSRGDDLWIGMKVVPGQKILGLSIDQKIWVEPGTREDKDALKAFETLMPPRSGERWVAYKIPAENLPTGFTYQSELKLNRHFATYPDAQTVTIVICYQPKPGEHLERKHVLVGHSLVQAPPPDLQAVKKKAKAKKAAKKSKK